MNSKTTSNLFFHSRIAAKLVEYGITLFGVADRDGIATLPNQSGRNFPRAVFFVRRMDPAIMAGIRGGHNQTHAQEYARANEHIDAAAALV